MQNKKRWLLVSSGILVLALVAWLTANELDEPARVALKPWPPKPSAEAHKGFLLMLGLAADPGEDQLQSGEKAEKEIASDPGAPSLRAKWDRFGMRNTNRYFDLHYRSIDEIKKNRAEIDQALAPTKEDLDRFFVLVRNGIANIDELKSAGRTPAYGIRLLQLTKTLILHWDVELADGRGAQVIDEAQALWRFDRANLDLPSSLLQTMIGLSSMNHVRDFINDAGADNADFRKLLAPQILASFQTQIDPLQLLNLSREWELGWINQMLIDPTPLGDPWNQPLSRYFISRSHQRILNHVDDLWQVGLKGETYEAPWNLKLYPFAYGAISVLHFDLPHQLDKVRKLTQDFAQPIGFTPPKVTGKMKN